MVEKYATVTGCKTGDEFTYLARTVLFVFKRNHAFFLMFKSKIFVDMNPQVDLEITSVH